MSRLNRPRTYALVVICFCLYTLTASATSVTVTGTVEVGNAAIDHLSVTAGIFSASSSAPDGPSQLGLFTPGIPSDINSGAAAYSSGHGFSTVNIGSTFTDILAGFIAFTGTITVPLSALETGTFTAPVDVLGQLMAFQDLTLDPDSGTTRGPLIATLFFHGTGTATFSGHDIGDGRFLITFAQVDFNGNGNVTVVPEPASVLLVSTGLGLLGVARRRRRAGASTS